MENLEWEQPKELNTKPRNKMENKKEDKKIEDKIVNTPKKKIAKAPEDKAVDVKREIKEKPDGQKTSENLSTTKKETGQTKDKSKENQEKKKPIQKKTIVKKTEAIVNVVNLPISTKHSIAVCKFIKNKKIENAISELEQVLGFKKAVPMKGEIPHRKGKGIMSGRYPKKATEHFIKLLKALSANANTNGLDNPVIVEAVANIASRPFGKFGRVRKKRTHVKIKCIEKKLIKKK